MVARSDQAGGVRVTLQSRAFEIFKRATDIPETEINHFLANECAQDVELRRLVEELLSVQVDASDLLPEQTSPPPIEIAEQGRKSPPVHL